MNIKFEIYYSSPAISIRTNVIVLQQNGIDPTYEIYPQNRATLYAHNVTFKRLDRRVFFSTSSAKKKGKRKKEEEEED